MAGRRRRVAHGNARVHLHLCQSSFCPGEKVIGAVTVQVLPGGAPLRLDALGLRLHGHARVDTRWISLPHTLRRLYNQDGDSGSAATPQHSRSASQPNLSGGGAAAAHSHSFSYADLLGLNFGLGGGGG
eukprot:CAMPEP_0118880570 /NCGR_PEP_ID=MMETSP1163-20130328/20126_1 /TAXON_ID=124430 /ORGANISM="Phaeomonas parva, Strain CCMP2877" /LENGTH=128 /DNA_ID=CAMNT_0006817033 /DNA_START=89 /DNA_END=471 /DNA_ORIENTATION=+